MQSMIKRIDDLTQAVKPKGVKPLVFIDVDQAGNYYTRPGGAPISPADYAALCETHFVVELVRGYDESDDDKTKEQAI